MESESGVTRSIIDELDTSDIQRDETEGERVLLEVSLTNFIIQISNKIKGKVKVALFELSLVNIVLWISNDIKFQVKVVLLEVSLNNFILGISKEIK